MYNPCRHCNVQPILNEAEGYNPYCRCPECRNSSLAQFWNENNPIDPRKQLTECHALLDLIAESPYSALENIDIKTMARDLVAKHRSENA